MLFSLLPGFGASEGLNLELCWGQKLVDSSLVPGRVAAPAAVLSREDAQIRVLRWWLSYTANSYWDFDIHRSKEASLGPWL